jgi:hypothetical protein
MLNHGLQFNSLDMMSLIIVFASGLICGSFLTVLTARLPHGKGFFLSRSNCPSCSVHLGFFDLVPLLSWVLLLGKCKYCYSSISIRYPLIELCTGIVFVCAKLSEGSDNVQFLMYLFCICALLISIFVIDIELSLAPRSLIYCIGLVSVLMGYGSNHAIVQPLVSIFLVAVVGIGSCYVCKLLNYQYIMLPSTCWLALAMVPGLTILNTISLLALYFCCLAVSHRVLKSCHISISIPKNALLALLGLLIILR